MRGRMVERAPKIIERIRPEFGRNHIDLGAKLSQTTLAEKPERG